MSTYADSFFNLERIRSMRTVHQFDIRSDGAVVYKRTSNSIESRTVTLSLTDNNTSSLKHVRTCNDVAIGDLVIIDHKDNYHLARIQYIDQSTQQVDVHCYVPPNPATTFYLGRSRDLRSVKIDVEHIVLALQYQPCIGSRDQVVLSD